MSKTVVIVGGGAAGIFAAIQAKASRVIVLEKTKQLLTKVKISGGGRCNVTNGCQDPKKLIQFYPRGGKELLGAFHHFGPKETVKWFEERGVKLKVEADGRIFPTTDSSSTIVDLLLSEAKKREVEIRLESSVSHAVKKDQFELQLSDGAKFFADQLILASGSSPQGHRLASSFGHTIVAPVPSLFSFNITERAEAPAGVTVQEVSGSIEGIKGAQKGPVVVTHWGFSGPAILKLSAFEARALNALEYRGHLLMDWVPNFREEQLVEEFKKIPAARTIGSEAQFALPKTLWTALLKRATIPEEKRIAHLSNEERRALLKVLKSDRYPFDGKTLYKEEFVTAGGVNLKEVDFKRMESKLVPGLHFAGELLDIDGVTGGFNFQAAWTTATLAASAV